MNARLLTMNRLIAIFAAATLLGGCGPSEETSGKERSQRDPTQMSATGKPVISTGATTGAIRSPRLKNTVTNIPRAEPAADWRTALSDSTVSAGIKEITVNKLGEERNAEAVPLLIENLLKIRPAYRASANNWTPCAYALIKIGEPAVSAVSDRFLVADTRQERLELFYILKTISGGSWTLEWLEAVRNETPFVDDEEFKNYWKSAQETAANENRRAKDWLKDHPEASETP